MYISYRLMISTKYWWQFLFIIEPRLLGPVLAVLLKHMRSYALAPPTYFEISNKLKVLKTANTI